MSDRLVNCIDGRHDTFIGTRAVEPIGWSAVRACAQMARKALRNTSASEPPTTSQKVKGMRTGCCHDRACGPLRWRIEHSASFLWRVMFLGRGWCSMRRGVWFCMKEGRPRVILVSHVQRLQDMVYGGQGRGWTGSSSMTWAALVAQGRRGAEDGGRMGRGWACLYDDIR